MFILSALIAAGLITELIAAARAPFGYQDESGFHFGQEDLTNSEKSGARRPS